MRRFLLVFLTLGLTSAARAGVIVVANFTPAELTLTVAEPDTKPRTVKLAPAQVAPVTVTGPADVTFPSKPEPTTFRLDPYNAYVFLPDEKAERRLEGVELPGNPPERDARPELNPAPRDPVKVPTTLLVDDADPRADTLWQKALRDRFDQAAAVVEAHAGVRFEFAGFDTWKSDGSLKDVPALLAQFEAAVPVKAGRFAVGYTSRKVEEKDREKDPAPPGGSRGFPSRHVLMREAAPRSEPEKVEALVHHLGLALGAAPTPDPGSVMRPRLGDGLALHRGYRVRFDPLNTLAMNLWADEMRLGPLGTAADASPANKARLLRVYKALLKARPGDSSALTYLNEFDRDLALRPEPKKGAQDPGAMPPAKNPDPPPAKDPPAGRTPRDDVARAVVRAVVSRAKANTGPGTLTGDALTAAYVRAAADAALSAGGLPADSPDRPAGFLVGLAVALDDTNALGGDVLTEAGVKAVEGDADRDLRLGVLGNPTVLGRRDFCRRFAIGCGTGELLSPARAEDVAVNRSVGLVAGQRPAGVSLPGLAAELAGAAFAKLVRSEPEFLKGLAGGATPASFLPDTAGLRDGLSAERFEADYGDPADDRFRAVLKDIHDRVKKVTAGP